MKKLSIMMLIVMVAVAGLLASAAADEAATASPAPSAGVRPSYCSCLKGITQTACEDGLKELCQQGPGPGPGVEAALCDSSTKLIQTSDAAAGRKMMNLLISKCQWMPRLKGVSLCSCVEDPASAACSQAANMQCLRGSLMCPAMVLGERADAFSRQVFARNITNSCKDKLSHQVLAMVFPDMPLQKFLTDAEPGIFTALARLSGVRYEYIIRRFLRGPGPLGMTRLSTGRKLHQTGLQLAVNGTTVAYFIHVPRSQGPSLKARLSDAMKDNAAGLYSALKEAGVPISPMVYLNGGAAKGDPALQPFPSPAVAAPSPGPAAPAPALSAPLGLILGTALGSVVMCALVAWCVVPSICARFKAHEAKLHPETAAAGKASSHMDQEAWGAAPGSKQAATVKVVGA